MPKKNSKIKQSGESTNCIIPDAFLHGTPVYLIPLVRAGKYGKSNSNSLTCTNQFYFTWHLKPYFDGAGKGKSFGRQTTLAKCNLAKVCKRGFYRFLFPDFLPRISYVGFPISSLKYFFFTFFSTMLQSAFPGIILQLSCLSRNLITHSSS